MKRILIVIAAIAAMSMCTGCWSSAPEPTAAPTMAPTASPAPAARRHCGAC